MEAVHPLKVVHKNFVSTVSFDYLKETVSLGLNALEGERRFYYLGEDGQVELIDGSVAWVDYSEILSMAYGVWVGEATPESTGVILVKCLVQGMRTQGDEKRISRLERILVKITKRQPGQVDGYIQAPAILQPAIDAIWTALSPRAMTPDNPIGEMTAGDQAGEPPRPRRRDVADNVKRAHELLKDPSSTPTAVFSKVGTDKRTYLQYCEGVTGEKPFV